MATENHSGVLILRKCDHGVYIGKDGVAWGCQLCQPAEARTNTQPIPELPRSSSDPLNANKTESRERCGACGCPRTFESTECLGCGKAYPETDTVGRAQGTANAYTPGSCPKCGSTVHIEKNKKTWVCADCDEEYPAVKRKEK